MIIRLTVLIGALLWGATLIGDTLGRWVPVGTQLAYLSAAANGTHISLADVTRGLQVTLIQTPGVKGSLTWSQDGRMLAYYVYGEGQPIIQVYELRNGDTQTLRPDNLLGEMSMSWSADRDQLAVVISAQSGTAGLHTLSLEDGHLTPLLNTQAYDIQPSWLPDSDEIAFSSSRGGSLQSVYVLHVDTGELRQVSAGVMPAWSADGSQIASINRASEVRQLVVVNADGTNPRVLEVPGLFLEQPAWSPDGRFIVIPVDDNGDVDLFRVNAETGELDRLTQNRDFEGHPAWSPDGKWIAFVSSGGGSDDIYLMPPDGFATRLSENPQRDWHPVWRP